MTVRKAIQGAGIMMLGVFLVACPQAIVPGIQFVECVFATYEKEPAGTPMPTVIADEIAACGGDAATIIRVLDDKEPRALHEKSAHQPGPVAPATSSSAR